MSELKNKGSLTVLAAKIPPSVKKTFFEEKSAKTCATTQSCGTHETLTAKIVKEPKQKTKDFRSLVFALSFKYHFDSSII
jgi:hypothetical protein